MEDAYQYHEVNSEQPEQSQNNDEPPKKKSKIKKILTIAYIVLSVLAIGGMSSNISSLESANNKLENENTDLEIQVDSLKELKDKNAELKSQLAEKEDFESKYNDLNSQIENYKDQQATINDQNNKLTELHSQYDSLQADRDNLQQQVDAKKAAEEQAAREEQERQLQQQQAQSNEATVYWTSGGECYHSTPNCATLKRSTSITRKNHWIKAERRKCYPSGKYFYYPTQTTTEDEALALGMLKVAVESLTDTQREILLSLVNGSRSSDVIEKLCISSATYYRQVRTIKQIIRGEKKDV